MSYENNIEKDRPVVYKTFDDATNKTHPLVAGLGTAALVTTSAFTHTFDQWTQMPFTLEIWFKPLSNNLVTVLGHDDDGIRYDGSTRTISFTVKQTDGTYVTTSQLADSKVMYLVAQYTGFSVNLMVNGSQSSEFTSLPLQTTGSLRTGAGKMSVDALAMYDYLLSDSQMERHYFDGISFPTIGQVYALADNYFDLTDASESVLVDINFTGWTDGNLDGAVINEDGNVINDIGVSNGIFYGNLILSDTQVLQGAKLYYEYTGTPPVVEVSIDDGRTWVSANRNAMIPNIPVGSAIGSKDPMLRATLSSDTALTYLRVVVYQDTQSIGNRSSSYLKLVRPFVSSLEQMYPYEQDTDGGANVGGGTVTVVNVTDDPIAATSFWYFGDEPSGGIKNGGLGHIADQWNFYYNTGTSLLTNYTGKIANVVAWGSTQDPAELYERHFVKQHLRVQDTYKISVSEPSNGVRVYQNNWIVL